MLLSRLWNLEVFLLSSPKTLLLYWVMSLSITVRSTREFRRLSTSGNTATKLADNEVGSTGSRYSSTRFQDEKGMSTSSSVPNDCMDANKASIFSGFVASPSPVRNTTFYFLLLSFSSQSVSTVLSSYEILDGDLPAPHCYPGIWHWWIAVFFSYTVLFLLHLFFILSYFYLIVTVN